jgi:hypothetical protein
MPNNELDKDPGYIAFLDQFLLSFFLIGILLVVVAVGRAFLDCLPCPYQPADRAHIAYPIATALCSIAMLAATGFFCAKHWPTSAPTHEPSEKSPRAKRVGIAVAFTLYLLTATLLTIWEGGARKSQCANLVLMSASLSTFAAKKKESRFAFGVITVVAYALTYFLAAPRDAPFATEWLVRLPATWGWRDTATATGDFLVVLGVVVASGYTGMRLRYLLERKEASAQEPGAPPSAPSGGAGPAPGAPGQPQPPAP